MKYKFYIADADKTYDSIGDLEKAGYKITGTSVGRPGTWIAGIEYPNIDGFLGGMRQGDSAGELIRYESQSLYDKLSN